MPDTTPNPPPPAKSKELYVRIEPMSKLYSHDMGCFPIRSLSGNYFTMLAYHVDTNIILVEPCQSLHDRHRLTTANRIMIRLQKTCHHVNLQILDNECSAHRLQNAGRGERERNLPTRFP